ncbi:NACHT, LRR and PYD domains-containing protein 3 [Alligator mississippiensis]|uniref:NACHT, LRR and PYD domains-containing protein 3 n=1 Tax=Alligator mississippiensis TaxID=8496 RepID=UPI00090746D2|nr:NACHT, LRR and PYD domains-containing protein 3 [Alligator mississippiensis]XP_019344163.1 NACHT, LRR and PYD domains-containing protein 3 [Alligator mississippiensis]
MASDQRRIVSEGDVTAFSVYLHNYTAGELRRLSEYFLPDLVYIIENDVRAVLQELSSREVLMAWQAQSYAAWEKDHDAASAAEKLVADLLAQGQDAGLGLWKCLYALQSRWSHPNLHGMVDEILENGHNLLNEILLNEYGYVLDPELTACQEAHKAQLHEMTGDLKENAAPGLSQGPQSFPISSRYVEIKVISDRDFKKQIHHEHEALAAAGELNEYRLQRRTRTALERITPDRLFRWCPRSRRVPLSVMVSGVAGVGKTTLVQKFVFDWATGKHYQKFTFVFFFKFRDLAEEKVSLESLLCKTYPRLRAQLGKVLGDPEKLLFIFDGLDESKGGLKLTGSGSDELCRTLGDIKPAWVLVASLLRQTLLKGCSVLLTSRPQNLASLGTGVFQRVASIVGFLAKERERYFSMFFVDEKVSQEAFRYVRDSQVLYTLCYNPSYCWITCTALKPCFATRDGKPPPAPKTVTQLFVCYITHILANHSLEQPKLQVMRDALTQVGWLAGYGITNRILVFDDNYMQAFNVKFYPFLTGFLAENPKSQAPSPVTYSFLHLTVQEFLAALVYYLDYNKDNLADMLARARACKEGTYDIFLRFLAGLSHPATRAPLERFLGKLSADAAHHVIMWLSEFNCQAVQSSAGPVGQRKLMNEFTLLFESRNRQLVCDVLGLSVCLDFTKFHLMLVDCTVLGYILSCCEEVERLTLNACFIQDTGLEQLGPELHKVRELSLVDNDLKDPSMKVICGALKRPDCRMEALSLKDNAFTSDCCEDLAFALKENQSLLSLDLGKNKVLDSGLSYLCQAFEDPHCRMQKLLLQGTGLSNFSCQILSCALATNTSLQHLNLSSNMFTDECAEEMRQLILTCPYLKEIRLGFCDFTPAMEENLKKLAVEGVKISF